MVDKKENKNIQCIQCQKKPARLEDQFCSDDCKNQKPARLEDQFCSDDCKNQWYLNNNNGVKPSFITNSDVFSKNENEKVEKDGKSW